MTESLKNLPKRVDELDSELNSINSSFLTYLFFTTKYSLEGYDKKVYNWAYESVLNLVDELIDHIDYIDELQKEIQDNHEELISYFGETDESDPEVEPEPEYKVDLFDMLLESFKEDYILILELIDYLVLVEE